MNIKTTRFKPTNFLQNDNEVAKFLSDAYQDEDPEVFIVAFGHVVKHTGIAKLAEATGLNAESLYKTFNGKVQPKWDTIHRLMKAMGIEIAMAA